MTFIWPRLTWPALALRHTGPWARKTSATSRRGRAMRPWSGGWRSACEVDAQPLQWALDVADRVDGDAGVECGRLELGVSEQHLDHANIDVLLEQMRGEAVPQGMRRYALGDPRHVRGGGHGPVELTGRHRVDRVLAGKQPDLRSRRPPPVAQQFEQLRREHNVAIPLPLALLDPKRHALAVDIGHLQVRDLGHAQARPVGDAERGLVLEAGRGFEQTRHLLLAQHDRRLARLLHRHQKPDEVWPFERHVEKVPQRGAGRADARRADMLLGQMQSISAKVLARRRIWRPPEEGREGPDVPDIVLLHLLLEPARRHVVDHALA